MAYVTRLASLAFLAFLAFVAGAAIGCISGDVDEERPTERVPAGLTPEDATFRFGSRRENTQRVLVIRLSSVAMCERAKVPLEHPFVQLEIVAPQGQDIGPGHYVLDRTLRARISLLRTTTPECASSAGSTASTGFVQLDEVGEDVVRGSFAGTNPDSKIDLQTSFVAKRCTSAPEAMCP